VKRIQPFESLAASTRFRATIRVADPAVCAPLAGLLGEHRGGRSELRLVVATAEGEAVLLIGRDFLLTPEAAERVERLAGVESVVIEAAQARLQLVG
jgi:DNA polymerase-3 subunit alpha